jgi:glutamyl-tRNA synthetase
VTAGTPGALRVRFAPAPTGDIHLGTVRTALFNWLIARHTGGAFILRIDDTDTDRCDLECEQRLIDTLLWLGLDWDEGPGVGGPAGPYRQSERMEAGVYDEALARLRAADAVYPCFCTAEELAAARASDESAGVPPRYRGLCCELDHDQAEARLAAGEVPAWRFRVEPGPPIVFDDLVRGRIEVDRAALGDFIVIRSTGMPTYDLAATVDDAAMGVDLVMRGEDHLPNTPRQMLLYEALAIDAPRWAHLPLVRDASGETLSKSKGSLAIRTLLADGYLPEAILNHVALLGWSDPGGREVLTLGALVDAFDPARVSRAPSTHDPARLLWLDAEHIKRTDVATLATLIAPWLPELPDTMDVVAVAAALQPELRTLADAKTLAAPLAAPLPLDDEASAALAAPGADAALAAALGALPAGSGDAVFVALRALFKEQGVAPKVGFPAIRAALTGRAHGLGIAELFDLLGPGESRRRLEAATMGPASSW